VFFHACITYSSTKLYQQYEVSARAANEAANNTEEYSIEGLPGCVGSCDATHIVFEKKEYRLRKSHLGFKTLHTAKTYYTSQ
jgi:hypothetical protein